MQGVAAVDAPITLQMEKNGRMIDVQPNRIRKADPSPALAASALRGWLGSMLGEEEEKIKELSPSGSLPRSASAGQALTVCVSCCLLGV